jgi:predicted O-methyltransferase YrrM
VIGITTTMREKRAIFDELAEMRAKRILEIGAYRGETTRILSDAASREDGYVVVIDPMIWSSVPNDLLERIGGWLSAPLASYESGFWRNARRGGHENVRLIRRLSTDAELVHRRDPTLAEFDAVFIDGDHTYPAVRADLATWGVRVRAGGKILLHDAIPRFHGVVRAIEEWADDSRVRIRWERQDTVCVIDVLSSLRDVAATPTITAIVGGAGASHGESGSNGVERVARVAG